MFRYGLLSLVLTVVALTTPDLSIGSSDQRVTGSILSASSTQVILMIGTESRTFAVTPDTTFTLDGKTVKPGDLKMDDRAEVIAIQTDGLGLVAQSVTATRNPKPGKVGAGFH